MERISLYGSSGSSNEPVNTMTCGMSTAGSLWYISTDIKYIQISRFREHDLAMRVPACLGSRIRFGYKCSHYYQIAIHPVYRGCYDNEYSRRNACQGSTLAASRYANTASSLLHSPHTFAEWKSKQKRHIYSDVAGFIQARRHPSRRTTF
jgi:hypothetical protein